MSIILLIILVVVLVVVMSVSNFESDFGIPIDESYNVFHPSYQANQQQNMEQVTQKVTDEIIVELVNLQEEKQISEAKILSSTEPAQPIAQETAQPTHQETAQPIAQEPAQPIAQEPTQPVVQIIDEKYHCDLDEQTQLLSYLCPHCDLKTTTLVSELACRIFRHGMNIKTQQQVPPHAPKNECDSYAQNPDYVGCCKPYQITQDNQTKKYIVQVCDYI